MSDKQKIRLLRYALAELLMTLADRLPTWKSDALELALSAMEQTADRSVPR